MQHVVEKLLGPIRRTVADFSDTAEKARLAHQRAGPDMIGMAVLPIRRQYDARPRAAQQLDHR